MHTARLHSRRVNSLPCVAYRNGRTGPSAGFVRAATRFADAGGAITLRSFEEGA